jgi:RNA polymerase sigma factor (sigma-70 family)
MSEVVRARGPFEAELVRLEPALLAFALRAVRQPDVARDLVQETLVAALATARPFEGRSAFRTWLLGILAHKAMDHFRRAGADRRAESDVEALHSTPSPDDVERTVMARQTLARVEAALQEVPERERLAMLMVDVEGLERDVVCHALDVTATHLRVLLHRGRNRVRRRLQHD